MVGYRAILAIILGAAVTACATSPSPSHLQAATPSGSPQITNVPDVPRAVAPPSAAPTPGPLTIKEAGTALLAAEERLNKAWFALQGKYYLSAGCGYTSEPCNKTEMKAGMKYWATLAAALGTYIEELTAIRFPGVATAEAAAHIKATGAFRDRALSASKATTLDSFNAQAIAAADARDTTYGVQELKDALGLPVGP